MSEGCCGGKPRGRMLQVGEHDIGVIGLAEIFEEVKKLGINDEEILMDELFKRAKIYNYIPSSIEGDYRKALLREYWLY